jgi:hypothetical protein
VIVAAPYFFASRILRGLPPDVAAAMRGSQQGAYLVANCCFEGKLNASAYDLWTPDNFAFTDAIDAQTMTPAAQRSQTRSVLTIYAPFKDPAVGRALLLEGQREKLAAPIIAQLRHRLSDAISGARLAQLRLTRWGHQHYICRPGSVSKMRALPKRFGNVLLAHSDGQALPAAESAIVEALSAAAIVRAG